MQKAIYVFCVFIFVARRVESRASSCIIATLESISLAEIRRALVTVVIHQPLDLSLSGRPGIYRRKEGRNMAKTSARDFLCPFRAMPPTRSAELDMWRRMQTSALTSSPSSSLRADTTKALPT
jgi:hypothetical protein